MGSHLKLEDFDSDIRSRFSSEPIILNDIERHTEADREALNSLIYTKYTLADGDILRNVPTCECHASKGEHLVNMRCPECDTLVKPRLDDVLEPHVWFRAPDNVDSLVNPQFWSILREFLTASRFNTLRWLCDTDYHSTVPFPATLRALKLQMDDKGLRRGFNSFLRNFDVFMGILFSLPVFTKKAELVTLKTFIKEYRPVLFPKFVPLPNKALMVIEESPDANYMDNNMKSALNAMNMMTGIDVRFSGFTDRIKENRAVRALEELYTYNKGMNDKVISDKSGIARKHMYGTLAHWSMRAVITPGLETQKYNHLHLPWGLAVTVFKTHLLAKLFRIGMTLNEAVGFLAEYTQKYSPMLDAMFKELISEVQPMYEAIPIILQRN